MMEEMNVLIKPEYASYSVMHLATLSGIIILMTEANKVNTYSKNTFCKDRNTSINGFFYVDHCPHNKIKILELTFGNI